MSKLSHAEETHAILGACIEVHREKGCGFLEAVFQECIMLELTDRRIPHRAQPLLTLEYKGRALRQAYEPDFPCFEKIIVELKAVSKPGDEHRAQLHNCLCATRLRVGLLVNFGHCPLIQHERIVV